MLRRSVLFCVLAGSVLWLPGSRALAQTGSTASTPMQAVAILVEPWVENLPASATCDTVRGKLASCPLSAQFRSWLQGHRQTSVAFGIQNPPSSVAFGHITYAKCNVHGTNCTIPSSTTVPTYWYFGRPSPQMTIRFQLNRQGGGWVVTDEVCGKSGKSIMVNVTCS